MSKKRHPEHLFELSAGEHVLFEVRRHMFFFYNQVLVLVVLFFAPLFFAEPVVHFINTVTESKDGLVVFIFFFILWFFVLWMSFFFQWTDYYLDVWVITNQRIFDIEQKGAFSRNISVFLLENVQDVSIEVNGIIATLLRYGDIHVHTAGESNNFVIHTAANPLDVKNYIMRAHTEAIKHRHTEPV